MSSNLSLATHDGATFTRRDGGRFSMRVEKSSTTGNLLSLTKQQIAVRRQVAWGRSTYDPNKADRAGFGRQHGTA
jgi:hypothetical protein